MRLGKAYDRATSSGNVFNEGGKLLEIVAEVLYTRLVEVEESWT